MVASPRPGFPLPQPTRLQQNWGDEVLETLTETPDGLRETEHILAYTPTPRPALSYHVHHGLEVVEQPGWRGP